MYVSIENRGRAGDRLVEASSPVARAISVHETTEENGIATMRPLDAPIPGGGTLEMKPGGIHMMLMDLSAPLTEGETLPLTLVFERAGRINVEASIASVGADGPEPGI